MSDSSTSGLKPGKGVHIDLTQRNLNFLRSTLQHVAEIYSDELHDQKPKEILDYCKAAGFEFEEDNFGKKVFKRIEASKGDLRLTIILTKKGELKLDIRTWYEG